MQIRVAIGAVQLVCQNSDRGNRALLVGVELGIGVPFNQATIILYRSPLFFDMTGA